MLPELIFHIAFDGAPCALTGEAYTLLKRKVVGSIPTGSIEFLRSRSSTAEQRLCETLFRLAQGHQPNERRLPFDEQEGS